MTAHRPHMEPFTCGACGTEQMVYIGDPDDCTLPDVDEGECHACGAVTRFCDPLWVETMGEENLFRRKGEPRED